MPDDFVPLSSPATFKLPQAKKDDFTPLNKYVEENPGQPLRDTAIEFARPFATDAAIAAGTASSGFTGPLGPAAGYLAGGVIDKLLQHLETKPPQGIISQNAGLEPGGMLSDLANTGEQIIGGKLMNAAVTPLVRGATNFVKGLKPAAQGSIRQMTQGPLEDLGATYSQYHDPNSYIGKISQYVEDTFARTSKQKAVANSAGIGFDTGKDLASAMANRPVGTVGSPELHGQLLQQEAISNQKQLRNSFNQFAAEAQFLKPQYQDVTTGYTQLGTPLTSRLQVNKNYDPKKYQDAVMNAKAISQLHDSLFDQKGLAGLVNDPNNTAVPFIDTILKDPQKLDRALATSSMKIPGTSAITTPQLRGDLQGYYLNKIIDAASKRDPVTGKIGVVNPQTLINQFADPSMTETVKKLYSAQQRSDITQLFSNLAKTQQKMNAGFSTGSKFFLAGSGVEMAASLLSGHAKFGLLGAVPATVRLGGYGLGKIMTNPTLARAMVSASSGQPMNLAQRTVARELANTLNGVAVTLVDSTGKETQGKFEQGEFVPIQQH